MTHRLNRWPESEPERPELRQGVPDGYQVRTRGDRMVALGLRIVGNAGRLVLMAFLVLILLYALNNIFH